MFEKNYDAKAIHFSALLRVTLLLVICLFFLYITITCSSLLLPSRPF